MKIKIKPRKELRMKNRIKNIFAALCTAILTVSAVPSFSAMADSLEGPSDTLTDGAFEYEVVNGGYIITKVTASIITKIPDIQNGVPVIGIGEGAFAGFSGFDNSDLIIPDTVKTIGKNAFTGCASIKSLTLPRRLQSMGDGAFAGCSGIESINIPETITQIPGGAFRQCDHLTSINIPDSVTSIGDYAFYQCTSLKDLTLPDSLTEIGDMAFGEMLSLSSIDSSGCSAFSYENNILFDQYKRRIYCASSELEGELRIPDGVEEIMPGAFSACPAIESLYIPTSVTTIGYGAFSSQLTSSLGYCTMLNRIDFSEGLTRIEEGAFRYTSVESLLFPSSLKEIGSMAFDGSYNLSRIVIPEGVETIGEGAFFECPKLKNVNVPKSVKNIGDYSFGFVTGASDVAKLGGFEMGVVSGSAAEKYAKSNNIEYTLTDKGLRRIIFIIVAVGAVLAAIVFGAVLMSRSRKTAPAGAKKAQKLARQKAEEESYKKIVDDSDDDPKEKNQQKNKK